MIIRYVIGTLLIATPIAVGGYLGIREYGWKPFLALLAAFAGVIGIFVGIYLLTT